METVILVIAGVIAAGLLLMLLWFAICACAWFAGVCLEAPLLGIICCLLFPPLIAVFLVGLAAIAILSAY